MLVHTAATAQADLIHRYSFTDSAEQTVILDSVGTANGTAVGGVALDGTHAILDGSTGYIDLPNHILANLTNVTFEAWITWNGGSAWQRVFDFGTSSNGEDASGTGQNYLFFSPRSGPGPARFAITPNSGAEESPVLDGPGPLLDDGSAIHVAITYGTNGARVFVNGQMTVSGPFGTDLSSVDDVNVWLGRSNWPDPYYDGSFDEFRMHDSILTSAQIAASMKAGPDTVNYVPGNASAVRLGVDAAMILGGQQIPVVTVTFSNAGEVALQPGEGATITTTAAGVVAVGADGSLQAVGVGAATIKATYAGKSSSVVVNVEASRPELMHRYSFTELGEGGVVTDSIGAQNGTVIPASDESTTVTLSGGKAVFPGGANYQAGGYIDLPNGMFSVRTNITVETWLSWGGPAGNQWQRVWDFGDSQKGEDAHAPGNGLGYLFLSPNSGSSTLRFAAKPDGPTAEAPVLDGKAALPVNKEVHVVVVYSPQAKRSSLYLDGVKIASGLAPFALSRLNDVNNWIGASQWNDPPFAGTIDEMRIWEGGFSDLDVALSRAAGPDTVRNSPGNLKSISAQMPALLQYATVGTQCTILADFDNATGVDITAVAGLVFSSTDTNVFSVSTNGVALPSKPGSATLRVSFQNQSATLPVTVLAPTAIKFGTLNFVAGYPPAQAELLADFGPSALNKPIAGFAGLTFTGGSPGVAAVSGAGLVTPGGAGGAPVSASFHGFTASGNITVTGAAGYTKGSLVHRYSFSEEVGATVAKDSTGTADGELIGGAAPSGAGKVQLNGTDGYVNLPNGIISALNSATFEGWVTWDGPVSQNWSRLFDFGSSIGGEDSAGVGSSFLFLSPRNGVTGRIRFDVHPTSNGPDTTVLDTPAVMATGQQVHFAVAYDLFAGYARVYLNGIRVATGPASAPLTGIEDINNWLGRSQYNDPYFKGSYNEFRIYDGPLLDGDIAASFAAGPDALPSAPAPKLEGVAKVGGGLTLSWPSSATGFVLQSSAVVGAGADWTPVAETPTESGGKLTVNLTPAGARFFRLTK